MASLRQRGKKRLWYALFRDAAGKLREKPTNTADRKTAQKMADEMEAAARPTGKQRTVESLRRAIAALYKDLNGRDLGSMSVSEFAKIWLETRKGEVAPETLKVYKRVTSSFATFLGDRASEEMFLVQREDVIRFRDAIASTASAPTANLYLRVLRMWMRQGRIDGWMLENPAELVKSLRLRGTRRNVKRAFTAEEIQKLLQTAKRLCASSDRWFEWPDIITRAYYTGQRLADVALMRSGQEDVLRSQWQMTTKKTSAHLVNPMHEAYVAFVLTKESSDDPASFVHPKAAATITAQKGRGTSLSSQFAEIMIAAGLRQAPPKRDPKAPKQTDHGKGKRRAFNETSFHSLRHSMATHLANEGVTSSVVRSIIGHESVAMTLHYTHIDQTAKKDAISKLPNITGIDIK